MKQKNIISPFGAVIRLLLVDIFIAILFGIQTGKYNEYENYIALITCVLFVYFFILYSRYKLFFYLKVYLMNMYGATSITIADLARNISKRKYTTRNIVKKIVYKQLLPGVTYDPTNDIFDISAVIGKQGRHFDLKPEITKQINFPFAGLIFIYNAGGILLLTASMHEISSSEDVGISVFMLCVALFVILLSIAGVYNHFNALRYLTKMIGAVRLPIQTLAEYTGQTAGLTTMSLQNLIKNRYLKNMIISEDKAYLTLPENIIELLGEQTFTGPVIKPEIKTVEQPTHQDNQSVINKGRMYVKEIRKMNIEMPDEAISVRLDKLESITEQIFNFYEKNAIKDDTIRKLLDYHLPTTLKLVSTYKDMDSIGSETQNIGSIKQEIIKSLDIITKAFEKILDQLAENLRINVEGEISALKTILEQDGLINNDPFKKQKD